VGGENIKITRIKYNSLPLSLNRYAGDCNKLHTYLIKEQQVLHYSCGYQSTPDIMVLHDIVFWYGSS